MSSENTATATALSFHSLPPELRVQIYRCLLCRSSWFQLQRHKPPKYWSKISRAKKALSGSEPKADRDISPEIAILRTCRTIYSEAIPILYGENTFIYLCWTTVLTNSDYPVTAFPDVNVKRIKHLKLDVEADCRNVQITTASIAATIRHFTERGCDLRTFELSLNKTWDLFKDERCLLTEVTASQRVMAALVELKVSRSLTISGWYHYQGDDLDSVRRKSLSDGFRKFVNRLASEKAMAATKQKSRVVSEYTAEDGTEVDSEGGDDDEDRFLSSYKLSWCLHPKQSEEQSAKMASQVD